MAALRLTFAYEGRKIELVDVQPVDAVAPEPPPSARGRAGFWLELRGRAGRPVFRRVLSDPLGGSVEAPTGDPTGSFERATVEDASGTFQVMVPDVEEGEEVAILHVDPERGKDEEERGRELGRFDVSRGRRGGRGGGT
jgi:hypothetical protein